jgi:hypothetical protein
VRYKQGEDMMKKICVFMLCLSVSFSVVVISIAMYEKIVAVAYGVRAQADYQLFIMAMSMQDDATTMGMNEV